MTIEQIKETTKVIFENDKSVFKIDSLQNVAVFTKNHKTTEGFVCGGKMYYEDGLKILEVVELEDAIEDELSSDIFDEAIYQKVITNNEANTIFELLKTVI